MDMSCGNEGYNIQSTAQHDETMDIPAKELPLQVIYQLSTKLPVSITARGNWMIVAEHLGYGRDEIDEFLNQSAAEHQSPAFLMLRDWTKVESGRSLYVLKECLRQCGRDDCVLFLYEKMKELISMELYLKITDVTEDRKRPTFQTVTTRCQSTLRDSLENVLCGCLEDYVINASWSDKAHKFKGRHISIKRIKTSSPGSSILCDPAPVCSARRRDPRDPYNNLSCQGNMRAVEMEQDFNISHYEESNTSMEYTCQSETKYIAEDCIHCGKFKTFTSTSFHHQEITPCNMQCQTFSNECDEVMSSTSSNTGSGISNNNRSTNRYPDASNNNCEGSNGTGSRMEKEQEAHVSSTTDCFNEVDDQNTYVRMTGRDHTIIVHSDDDQRLTGSSSSHSFSISDDETSLKSPYRHNACDDELSPPSKSNTMETTNTRFTLHEEILPSNNNNTIEAADERFMIHDGMPPPIRNNIMETNNAHFISQDDRPRHIRRNTLEPIGTPFVREIPNISQSVPNTVQRNHQVPPTSNNRNVHFSGGVSSMEPLRDGRSSVGKRPRSPQLSHFETSSRSSSNTSLNSCSSDKPTLPPRNKNQKSKNDYKFVHICKKMNNYDGWNPEATDLTIDSLMQRHLSADGYFMLWYMRSKKTLMLSVSHLGKLVHYGVYMAHGHKRSIEYFIFDKERFSDLKVMLAYYIQYGLKPQSEQADSEERRNSPRDSSHVTRLSHVRLIKPVVFQNAVKRPR